MFSGAARPRSVPNPTPSRSRRLRLRSVSARPKPAQLRRRPELRQIIILFLLRLASDLCKAVDRPLRQGGRRSSGSSFGLSGSAHKSGRSSKPPFELLCKSQRRRPRRARVQSSSAIRRDPPQLARSLGAHRAPPISPCSSELAMLLRARRAPPQLAHRLLLAVFSSSPAASPRMPSCLEPSTPSAQRLYAQLLLSQRLDAHQQQHHIRALWCSQSQTWALHLT
jgi:hypothetical protein